MTRKSTGDYPPNWRAIAKAIKDEHDWRCIRCGHPHDPQTGYTLTIHHADMNPANNEWYNLLCLCQRCHLVIQSKVVLERPWFLPHSAWFRPYVAGYYASVHHLPTDKEFVLAHVDELIALGQSTLFAEDETQELADYWPDMAHVGEEENGKSQRIADARRWLRDLAGGVS